MIFSKIYDILVKTTEAVQMSLILIMKFNIFNILCTLFLQVILLESFLISTHIKKVYIQVLKERQYRKSDDMFHYWDSIIRMNLSSHKNENYMWLYILMYTV